MVDDNPRDPQVIYRVLVELERRIGQCSEELRPQLATALDGAYNRTWRVAPLARLRLFEVRLDSLGNTVIESKVTATTSPKLRVRVGALGNGSDDQDDDEDDTP